MKRRYSIILLCTLLSLLLLGCQSYTASQGKAAIPPLASSVEEKTITKYSLIQAKEEAQQREKALEEQRAQATLIAQQLTEREAQIASLSEQEQTLQTALVRVQNRLTEVAQENQQLQDTLTQLVLERDELLLMTQLSTQEGAERILALEQQNSALSDTITDLQSRIEENEQFQQEQQEQRARLEQERATLLAEQEQETLSTLAQLNAERDALKSEVSTLTKQLEQTSLTLEEERTIATKQQEQRALLEQERATLLAEQEQETRSTIEQLNAECNLLKEKIVILTEQLEQKILTINEWERLEQERKIAATQLKQQQLLQTQAQKEEQQRLASIEQAKQREREKEWAQIPSLDQITFPRLYKTEKPTHLASQGEPLSALMLPLDDVPWKDPSLVKEVHTSISDLETPIIFVTGHMENVLALVKKMRLNAALFSTGAIITSFPIQELSTYSALVQYEKDKTVRLVVANLPEYQVVQRFIGGGDWQAVQKKGTPERLARLTQMVGEGELTTPTLVGASLYEPSNQDWNTFSPVTYRQLDYLWPLSEYLESEGFFDIYRVTHFSESTSAGNTIITPKWAERVDYLYSRKMLPLFSTMLTIGGESAPDEKGISRFGVLGTFLVP